MVRRRRKRKAKKTDLNKLFALPQLVKKSVYDVIEESFAKVKLKVFITRLFYAGDHFLSVEELIELIEESVKVANQGNTDGELTGLLIVYKRYFIHIVEGSEDTLYRHLRYIMVKRKEFADEAVANMPEEEEIIVVEEESAASDDGVYVEPVWVEPDVVEEEPSVKAESKVEEDFHPGVMFKRLKVLAVYHSITKRFFDGWDRIEAEPPILVGKMDKFLPIGDHMEHLRTVIKKIHALCGFIWEDNTISFSGLTATDKRMGALPEYLLMDYVMDSPHILDLEVYISHHRTLDEYIFFFEKVWPIPASFTPRNLYKLKIDSTFVDPLPLQPWQSVEEEDDEEKEESDESELLY